MNPSPPALGGTGRLPATSGLWYLCDQPWLIYPSHGITSAPSQTSQSGRAHKPGQSRDGSPPQETQVLQGKGWVAQQGLSPPSHAPVLNSSHVLAKGQPHFSAKWGIPA